MRFERMTFGLGNRRSIQLSYEDLKSTVLGVSKQDTHGVCRIIKYRGESDQFQAGLVFTRFAIFAKKCTVQVQVLRRFSIGHCLNWLSERMIS